MHMMVTCLLHIHMHERINPQSQLTYTHYATLALNDHMPTHTHANNICIILAIRLFDPLFGQADRQHSI